MAKAPTNRQPRAKAPAAATVTPPAAPALPAPATSETTPPAPPPAPAAPASAPVVETSPEAIASVEKIRMLVGQEGPNLSRVRGQVLTIGGDLDAAEAERLVVAQFAERI